jgi:hypothetical protein
MKFILVATILAFSLSTTVLGQSASSTVAVEAPSPVASPAVPAATPVVTPSPAANGATGTKPVVHAPGPGGSVVLPAEKANPVTIPRFDKAPVIDGKLDDAVWQNAAVLKDFYQIDPGDNTPPSKPTEVLIGYDPKFLYIAFRAFDEPDKIRSTIAKRDNIWQDDYVGFYLDTFNDKRKAFEMFFNPLGIQGDGVLTEGRGEDMSVDILMDSKGVISEMGYIVEIAIPFKSIRYEAGKG